MVQTYPSTVLFAIPIESGNCARFSPATRRAKTSCSRAVNRARTACCVTRATTRVRRSSRRQGARQSRREDGPTERLSDDVRGQGARMVAEMRAVISGHQRANDGGVLRDRDVEDIETRAALTEPNVDEKERPVGMSAKDADGRRRGRCAAPHEIPREHLRQRPRRERIILDNQNASMVHATPAAYLRSTRCTRLACSTPFCKQGRASSSSHRRSPART
jgi:hypothetical protein